ncbi:MAG: class I SAM-dependent methyltransferase [Candidatus Brockarchaeota archaeon]|nr:class I SAM-dependent methyltransferase [Candidatus Brockarchaeota archaeon]
MKNGGMFSEKGRDEFYHEKKQILRKMYWEGNDGSDVYRPNGFSEYPCEIYNVFLNLIDHDGNVIDLGCGNGLMLCHLVTRSNYKLTPYGVDFIEESIEQAKKVILPKYAENFTVANIVDIDLGFNFFDFIFFDPYDVHPDDLRSMINKLLKACKPGGKIVFYTYPDVLVGLSLKRRSRLEWVGDLLPPEIARKLKRIDHEEVSVGVYET